MDEVIDFEFLKQNKDIVHTSVFGNTQTQEKLRRKIVAKLFKFLQKHMGHLRTSLLNEFLKYSTFDYRLGGVSKQRVSKQRVPKQRVSKQRV